MGPLDEPGRGAARRRRAWPGAALSLPACVLLASNPLSGSLWAPDVVMNLAPQMAGICACCFIVATVRRRCVAAALSFASIAMVAWVLGADRAARSGIGDGGRNGGTIRVLHANVLSSNPRIDEAEAFVLGGGHDVVTLMELPRDIGRAMRSRGAGERYAHMMTSGPIAGYAGWVTVLSVWPLEAWNGPGAGGRADDRTGTMCVVAQRPQGPLGIVAVHASSPWAPGRWRVGNETARRAAAVARQMREAGLPVIVVGDLNSSPTGTRSRRLASAVGVKRCKPLWRGAGTYPAWLVWPLTAAIDDALVSDDLSVAGWRTLECPGSDHSAVEMELVVSGAGD
jgi:endonuclease/exonuclease/phosphatase (EEP) superfamily protein YafD